MYIGLCSEEFTYVCLPVHAYRCTFCLVLVSLLVFGIAYDVGRYVEFLIL